MRSCLGGTEGMIGRNLGGKGREIGSIGEGNRREGNDR